MPALLTPAQAQSVSLEDLSAPLVELLDQLRDIITAVTPQQYAQHPVGPIESSIGAHIRHCLDHVAAFVAFIRSDGRVLDYDRRERGTAVETDSQAAMSRIVDLQKSLADLPLMTDEQIPVRTVLSPSRAAIVTTSSIGRELSFVIHHTIHHNAIIHVIVKLLGSQTSASFGVAPSTLVYREGR